MIVISDSTPLMHFGMVDRLDLLRTAYQEIVITSTVYHETVTEGIKMGENDAHLIEKEIGKWIKINDPDDNPSEISQMYDIHQGEAASILLAKQLNADLLLINERDGRNAAKSCGIHVKGTIGVIADCVHKSHITKEDAINILLQFRNEPSRYWINPRIIDMAIKHISD